MTKFYLFHSSDSDDHILEFLAKEGVKPQSVDPISIAKQILHEMTIPSRKGSYDYMAYIVMRGRVERGALTKEIYPDTAKAFGARPINIERTIRFAIKTAWERGFPPQFLRYFPATHERPSNLEFLKILRELVEQRLVESAEER